MKILFSKLVLSIVLIIFLNTVVYGNAAQPGIWNAGGTVFTMLHPEDSLSFRKVQMQREVIYIQLYKGYAVVKGVYWFRNTTNDSLHFKMGYPINGIYAGGENDLNEVSLDSLSQFKIKAKNNWLPLLEQSYPELSNSNRKLTPLSDNWKVWDMTFEPNEAQKVEVYFIVNTNEAKIRKGYNVDNRNAFIYLLESGSVWHLPIEKGEFYVQLMDGLLPDDINGISAGFNFKYNDKHNLYLGQKHNFSPGPNDNLIISYHEQQEDLSFENILSKADNLYLSIEDLSTLSKNDIAYETIELGDPYNVKTSISGYLPLLLTYFVIYLPVIISVIAILLIIIIIWNRRKVKNNS